MENNIKIEFIAKLDKEIYENSPWKTREEFFKKVFIDHVGSDANFLEKQGKKLDSPYKEEYVVLCKTLREMKDSINESIKYELINTSENIEDVKIIFNFEYYEISICDLEKMINAFIFNAAIQDNKFIAEDIVRMANLPKNAGVDKSKVDFTVKMFNHVADFMEDAKSSLVVTKDDVVIGNTFLIEEQKKSKNKP